jgi:hypothetical protein
VKQLQSDDTDTPLNVYWVFWSGSTGMGTPLEDAVYTQMGGAGFGRLVMRLRDAYVQFDQFGKPIRDLFAS